MNLFLIPSTGGLSELLFTWPFLAINLLRASRKESISKLWATSICTARMDTHVKITPYRLTRLRARLTWKGPKQSTPTVVKGCWSGVRRSSGGSAIFCSRTGAWRRRQPTHLDSILLSAELPLIIQNRSRKRLKPYSLPEWPEMRWKCFIKRLDTWSFFGQMIWCLLSKDVWAHLSLPPTRNGPSTSIGSKLRRLLNFFTVLPGIARKRISSGKWWHCISFRISSSDTLISSTEIGNIVLSSNFFGFSPLLTARKFSR